MIRLRMGKCSGIDLVNARSQNSDAAPHAGQGSLVGHAVDSLRHAGNNGDAAGRETARHIGGHREPLGSGPTRAHNGKGRSLQQGNIAPAIQQHRRVGQFAQLPGIAGVCPEQDARVQAAGLIPLFPRGDPPGTSTHFRGLPLVQTAFGPALPRLQGLIGGAEGMQQAHTGACPQSPAVPKGQTGPVFPPGGFIHGRPGGNGLACLRSAGRGHRPGGHGFLCPHGQRASPRERAIRAASELGKSASRVRYFWAAPGLSPRRLRLMPALSRASAFL